MPLNIELPPIPDNIKAFLQEVSSIPLASEVVFSPIPIMVVRPAPDHGYQLRSQSHQTLDIYASAELTMTGPLVLPDW
jgi:hypothetical protein